MDYPLLEYMCMMLGETWLRQDGCASYVNRYGEEYDEHIYLYDLTTDTEILIPVHLSDRQIHPDIYGDKVVFRGRLPYDSSIYVYDLSTGEEKRITPYGRYVDDEFRGADQYYPAIYKDKVVYLDVVPLGPAGEIRNIYMYDLSLEVEVLITVGLDGRPYEIPDIYENRIVWTHKGEDDN